MLQRRLRLLEAVSLNTSTMVGIGPFITIPLLVASMNGPQAMAGWVLGAAVALADGLVWCELAAAFPGSGGTYHFYDSAYGDGRAGRLLKFLFVWQFFFSGPLEIASGAVGLAKYLGYFSPALLGTAWSWGDFLPGLPGRVAWGQVAAVGVMGLATLLAYRRIEMAGRLMVVLWVGMLATVGWVIATGLLNFDASRAFDFPPDAWSPTGANALGLGAALAIAMYDYLGYYQVCYLGDEVAEPARTIPRSILISVVLVSLVYLTMNVSILGVVPCREVVKSDHAATDMMLRVHGSAAAGLVSAMIVWTAMASVFASLLAYSRVPYASAKAGHFFRAFAATHPRGDFPHRSLILIGGITMAACLFELETIIAALLSSRILIQFVGQIVTVFLLHARPDAKARLPFRMPFYPIPAVIALLGWLFVFGTTDRLVLAYGVGSLLAGLVAFAIWDRTAGRGDAPP
ncbi:Serine/threonine exchanger SteT [Aquisphaera giovannonii]|uniref:Serine/threonine exchanger SteT n=1 Tax=Aquisphaera giovannonii TaxID=406548 RepID=A0A5B9W8U7_9BACT|nr:APC family permease [Aquisphaera giovannonii]QEH37056.1 Serine/threonine exchanger SteT [Aquisphaera giovannonii]